MNTLLYTFRLYHNLEPTAVCDALQMPTDEYEALESGIEIIDAELARRFADFYHVPAHIFITDQRVQQVTFIYSHNHFENSNAYVHELRYNSKLFESLIVAKEELIAQMKQEIEELRKQNNWLVKKAIEDNLK